MTEQADERKKRITIQAPMNSDPTVPGAILSVEVAADEWVQWMWTHYGAGKSAVTGYQIIKEKKKQAKDESDRKEKS